jgi:transmembrane sensor
MEENKDITFEALMLGDHNISHLKVREDSDPTRNDVPEKTLEDASEMTSSLKNFIKKTPPVTKETACDILLQKIKIEENISKNHKPASIVFLKHWSVAASVILIIGLALITYLEYSSKFMADTGFHEIIVPTGEKSQVVLSDGSSIWLNSESKFRYPDNFKTHAREVYLEGEAFFDIKKDNGKPFFVHANDIKVKVLGTEFNIKNYSNDETFEATVIEGSVLLTESSDFYSFNPVILKKDEKAVLFKSERSLLVESTIKKNKSGVADQNTKAEPIQRKPSITITKVDTDPVISWKDHLLVFDNETMGEMAKKMARWYKMPVQIQDSSLINERYTGKFVNNETIYQVLRAIKETTPIKYKINDNKVFIYPSDKY